MKSLKRTKADHKEEKEAAGDHAYVREIGHADDEGPEIRLEHHHLKKLGVDGHMKSGHHFTIEGRGHVEHSEEVGDDGKVRHSARLRLTHADIEHEGDEAEGREGLKDDVKKAFEGSEKLREERDSKGGKKIPEKKG